MSNPPNTTEHSTSVEFKSIVINSDAIPVPIDVVEIVTNIDIYEHLDKPYLTGAMSLSDSEDVVSNANISGGETVTIKLQSTRKDSVPIQKTFRIAKISASQKTSNNVEFYVFYLIEDTAFKSSLKNVNKSYSGTPYDIISKISKGFLDDKGVLTRGVSAQNMKVIIPNLSPLESMSWIKNKSCTSNGYPFYLTSTLVNDELFFVDLESLLGDDTMTKIPYTYGGSISNNVDPIDTRNRRVILKYNMSDTEDLVSMIERGLVGAEYRFINPTKGTNSKVDFDIKEHVMGKLVKDFNIDKDKAPYPDKNTFNTEKSRVIARAGSTNPYEGIESYLESKDESVSGYRRDIISDSVSALLKKNPMTILVNGIDFLDGDSHKTIGRKIDIRFSRNVAPQSTNYQFDDKKSGAFLIYSTKHSFGVDDYVVALTCVKIDNDGVKNGK